MVFASRDNTDVWKVKPPSRAVLQTIPGRLRMENVSIPENLGAEGYQELKANLSANINPDATRVEVSDTEFQALEEQFLMAVTAGSTDAYETKIDIQQERRDAYYEWSHPGGRNTPKGCGFCPCFACCMYPCFMCGCGC